MSIITKDELEKLKELAGNACVDKYTFVSNIGDQYAELMSNLTPQKVLRLIEALEVTTNILKIVEQKNCHDCGTWYLAQEALDKIYGE